MTQRIYTFVIILSVIFFTIVYFCFLSSAKKDPAKKDHLTIYTWLDFIPPSLQKKFESLTNIKLYIDYIDSDEGLEAKLLTGKAEYDIVYPSTPYVFRHIQLGLYKPLTLEKIPNLYNINPDFVKDLQVSGQIYALPYLWGTSGFAYDVETFNQVFPDTAINSWGYLFDPHKIQKISHKGIAATSSGNELLCAINFWKGKNPQGYSISTIEENSKIAQHSRPYWRVFLSSEAAIQALGSGEVAIAFMWNGDALAAQKLSTLHHRKIQYVIPKEGALKWIDSLAVPHNAPNPSAAYLFINFLLEPEHMAEITNYVKFANTSSRSKKYIHPDILKNETIYPNERVLDRLAVDKRLHPQLERTMNRHFFKILVGY